MAKQVSKGKLTTESKKQDSKCPFNCKGEHHYQFQQIVQPVYHNATANSPALSLVGNARMVQACQCGFVKVGEV